MRVLIATDAFPPVCGGSGWSTYELAKGLRARGHELLIVRPLVWRAGRARSRQEIRRLSADRVSRVGAAGSVRSQLLQERTVLSSVQRLPDRLHPPPRRRSRPRSARAHGSSQHHGGSRRVGVPVVCTVRDYWPVCYWSDSDSTIRGAGALCPGCTAGRMTQCVRPHGGALWPLALPAIPYMRANLVAETREPCGRGRGDCASAAPSRADLRSACARAGLNPHRDDSQSGRRRGHSCAGRIGGAPDAWSLRALRRQARAEQGRVEAACRRRARAARLAARRRRRRLRAGRNSKQAARAGLVGTCGSRAGVPRDEVLAWLRHAELLVFPSHGPESLSRVLLEASALGVADCRDGDRRHLATSSCTRRRGCCRARRTGLAMTLRD